MSDFNDLSDEFAAPASAPQKPAQFASLSDEFGAAPAAKQKVAARASATTAPKASDEKPFFQTSDPVAMRAHLAANNPELLPAFDAQFPDLKRAPVAAAPSAAAPTAAAAAQPPAVAQSSADAKSDANGGGFLRHTLGGIVNPIVGGYSGLWQLLKTGDMDKASQAVKDWTGRTYNPAPGTVSADMVRAMESSYNPLNWIPNASAWAGKKAGDALADMGFPGVGAIAVGAGSAAPLLLGTRPVQSAIKSTGARIAGLLPDAAKPALRIEPSLGEVAGAEPEPYRVEITGHTEPSAGTPSAGAASPAAAPATPSEVLAPARAGGAANEPQFPEVEPVSPSGTFPKDEQIRRAQVLSSVGIDNPRTSSITGDHLAASTDHQTSLVDSPAGRIMRDALDAERSSLSGAMDRAVESSGGADFREPMGQNALLHRGEAISDALTGLRSWYENKTDELYRAAGEKAQGIPTDLDQFRTTLGDESLITNPAISTFRNAVQAKAKQLNIIRDDGSIFSDGQQAETLRKYLNTVKDPALFDYIRQLKGSLDQDVLSAAGEDVYAAARNLWKQRKDTIDNPTGISRIGASSGPDGINRPVPIERIPSQVTSMPYAQLQHVVETLKGAPEEVQPQAGVAINEIRSQFANELREVANKHATQWNSKGVRDYLAKNSASLGLVFSPEEMANFRNISDAGQIVSRPTQYPGAAAQGHNLARAGVMAAVQNGAAGAGGLVGASIGGPAGALVGNAAGNFLGAKAAQKIGDAGLVKSTQKRFTKLSDLVKGPDNP